MPEPRRPAGNFELLRLVGIALIFLLYRAWLELVGIASGSGSLVSGYGFSPKWLIAVILAAAIFLGAGWISAWAVLRPRTLLPAYQRLTKRLLAPLGRGRYAIAAVLVCAPAIALLGDWGKHLVTPSFRIALLVLAGILAGAVISDRPRQAVGRIGFMVLLSASLFAAGTRLVLVTDYPFKLYWSEGNRLWDYSLYFARDRYQFAEPFEFPGYLTPGRHGLWGLPFLIPGAGIVLLRLWDAMLWVVPALAMGWALARRYRESLPLAARLAIALWGLLFLTQIGVFAPLTLGVLAVVLWIDPERPGRSAAVAAIASLYAGLSRWTWFAAPAVIAALWMLLDTEDRRSKLNRSLGVGLAGLAGGLLSQAIMSAAFPQQQPVFSTSLTQPLLWERLLPNPTNEQGILLGALIAGGPLLGLLIWSARRLRARWGWLGGLGLSGSLVAFLAVGLVASVKIGGGSNLHNLDMFMIGLMVVVSLALRQLACSGSWSWESVPVLAQGLLILAVLVPSADVMRTGGPLQLPSEAEIEAAVGLIQERVSSAAAQGPVLFVDQRQLLTFGQISGVPLVSDYELKDVMNQAMGANLGYFDQFRADLAGQRFALILTDPLAGFEQGAQYEFGEENDAWLRFVSQPLLESYEVSDNLKHFGVQLLTPRADR